MAGSLRGCPFSNNMSEPLNRILLASPDPAMGRALQAGLGPEWEVVWAGSGLEALRLLLAFWPRLAIITAELPLISGLQVCRLIKGEAELRALPLILLHVEGYRLGELLGSELDVQTHITIGGASDLADIDVLGQIEPWLKIPSLPRLDEAAETALLGRFSPGGLLPWVSEELNNSTLELVILRALAQASTKVEDLPVLLRELLLICEELLAFGRAGIYFYEDRTLYTLESVDEPIATAEPFRRNMVEQAEIYAGLLDFDGEPTVVPLGRFNGPVSEEEADGAFFAVPLESGGDVIGVLGIQTHKNLTRRDYFLRTLGELAQQIGLALVSARLYQRVQMLSRIDELTRLFNRRYFFERSREELSRARRFRQPLSLIMSDLDFFKKVNDTYGHQQGDVVLRETAQLFRKHLRSIDVPGRYGGEEYIILLPNTPAEGALMVAERLRQQVAAFAFTPVEGATPLRCTASFGVATYTEGALDDIAPLIAAADEALYQAKDQGRNRVVAGIFGPVVAT
ncbi:MAG: diguanylate cyclase [bacterium]